MAPGGEDAEPKSLVSSLWFPVLVFGGYATAFWYFMADVDFASRIYPQGIIAFILVLVLSDVLSRVMEWLRDRKLGEATLLPTLPHIRSWYRPAGTIVLLTAFIWSIQVVGFYWSATAFYIATALLLGERRPIRLIGSTILVIGFSYLLFSVLLGLRLP